MKTITLVIEQSEDQLNRDVEHEVMCAVKGETYYKALLDVYSLLYNYDSNHKLSEEQKSMLDDIRKKSQKSFKDLIS